jgi:hypothetical protein
MNRKGRRDYMSQMSIALVSFIEGAEQTNLGTPLTLPPEALESVAGGVAATLAVAGSVAEIKIVLGFIPFFRTST